jgi:hypothetical protein
VSDTVGTVLFSTSLWLTFGFTVRAGRLIDTDHLERCSFERTSSSENLAGLGVHR